MILNSKYGYIYIFSKNNAFILNDNNYNLNIFIKELNKYIDITSTIIIDKNNIFNFALDVDESTTNLIYKAVGIIVALISIREIFNTLSRSKYSIQELLGNIKNFTNLSMASLPKLLQFGSRYRADAEENSKLAQRDTIQNNKEIAISLKELPSSSTIDYVEPVKDKVAQPTSSDDFFF